MADKKIEYQSIHDLTRAIASELANNLDRVEPDQYMRFLDLISDAPRLFVAGAGRSGLMGRAFAMRLMHLGKKVFVVGEIVTPAIGVGDVLLILSGSGETGSLVGIAERALVAGATVALVTIRPDSTIGRLAAAVVELPGVTQKLQSTDGPSTTSIQPMGSLFEQSLLLLLDATVMLLMDRSRIGEAEMFSHHANLE